MESLIINLLGPFEVTLAGVPVTGFTYAKVRALLAYLALQSGPHQRAELAALLWPEQPERAARASLSQALTTLRTALGEKHGGPPLLLADAQQVQLAPAGGVAVDVAQFVALLRAADTHSHRNQHTCAICAARLRQALDLYRGALLADLAIGDSAPFEEWATLQREHLAQRALTALERLVAAAEWRGAYPEALSDARRLVALDPLVEASQRTHMRLLALHGEAGAALVQYRQLCTLLNNELAAEPEAATTALYEQIRRGDLARLRATPPPCVVPLPPTALVGRTAELGAIVTRLQTPAVRAVTILGTGGVGKTRLALEVAHSLRYEFVAGIYLVELAALRDANLVPLAIAQVLGVKERAGQPISQTLADYLRPKQVLLILDNIEQVVDAAPMIAQLLLAAPGLTLLLTSRTPLHIRAEQQFLLEPLPAGDALELFVQRAQAVGANLAADPESTSLYMAICQRVDRLPLALELIAVRARSLAPRELLQQLGQPLRALAQGPRDAELRHQSLRDTIQWSYALLDDEARRVFRYLGVFAGGYTAAAVQAVVAAAGDLLPLLEVLDQASLLQRQVIAEQTRFFSLETIREFALEQLASCGEATAAQARHAAYYADFAMAAYVELLRPEAPRWWAWVAAEQDNLRLAFGWALEHQQYPTALQIATGTWRFYNVGGRLREGLERLEAALVHREHAPLALQANALRAAGTMAIGLNDYPRARHWLEAAVAAGWQLGDQGALQPALTNLGFALLEQGELDDARIHLEVSLSLAQRAADPTVAKFPLGFLARLHQRLGEYAQAQALSEAGLRLNQACRDTEGTADALRTLATIVLAQGDLARAHALSTAALELHRSLNHQLGIGQNYMVFGDIALAQGSYAEALAHYQACLSLWQDRGATVQSAVVLDGIAQTLSRLGDPARAATLISVATSIRTQAGVRLAPLEQAASETIIGECRAALGEPELARAWAAGRTLTIEAAISLALQTH